MMKAFLLMTTILSLLTPPLPASQPDELSLKGQWQVQLDPENRGREERWFARSLEKSIPLPGDLSSAGLGEPVTVKTRWTGQVIDGTWYDTPQYKRFSQPGSVKIPFWLQPLTHYIGAAWYRKTITIPSGWAGLDVVLSLERPHGETTVWLDDRELGSRDSLSTPHVFDLGPVSPGAHTITVRVNNAFSFDVGLNAHSVSDHTQGNWNGIVGRLALTATNPLHIENPRIAGDAAERTFAISGRVVGGRVPVTITVETFNVSAPQKFPPVTVEPDESGDFCATLSLGDKAPVWDEFQPALYRVTLAPQGGDPLTVTTGLRTIATEGTQFVLNGRRIFLRGALECAIWPRTGHPPTDLASWKHIYSVARAHGLNHLRFHSWCPPEAAFLAADEMGFYLSIEAATWASVSTQFGAGHPIDRWIYAETDRILQTYGNHPSFLFMVHGNEPGGDYSALLADWVRHFRAQDPRRLYCAGAGWPELPVSQFHITPAPRIQQWGEGLNSRINALPPATTADYRHEVEKFPQPIVSHEIGQWCVYPDFREIASYTGYLKPRNFEIFRQTLAEHGMADQSAAFLEASGKLQALCYKEEIEALLRTPGMGGFQLLGLQDFPGQGTALVGVVNAFWESKGYISPEAYRRFCGPTVPLARLSRRVFTTADTLDATVEAAHFGPTPLARVTPRWRLVTAEGKLLAEGKLPARDLPVDNGIALGEIAVPLASVPAPARCRLEIELPETGALNDWDIWVYPPVSEVPVPDKVTVTRDLPATLAALEAGATVLWIAPPEAVRNDPSAPIAYGFSPIFWNTAWTNRQAPTTLGILCDPSHPAFALFPTENHSDWQWWYPAKGSNPFLLDAFPADYRPVVQVIDDWFTNRKLGFLIEGRVSKGRLMATSLGLAHDDPVSRQLRQSILAYMASPKFQPATALTSEELRSLVSNK